MHSKIIVEAEDPRVVFGTNDENLRTLEELLGVRAAARGNEVRLEGEPEPVARAEHLLRQLSLLASVPRLELSSQDVRVACRLVAQDPSANLKAFFTESSVRVTAQRNISPKTFNQKRYLETIRSHDITFGIGPAGTGKTYLAIAMAVQALSDRTKKRVILARPAVEAGEHLGFLPGDLFEKVHPYLRPLYDALHDMLDAEVVARFVARGVIEVAPIGFMRGRTLNDSFIILDEAQNTTTEQMKMFLTRLGFNSKTVITGDVTQTDLPPGKLSGLREARRILADLEGLGFVTFDERDVVRHPLVQTIIRAYEEDAARSQPGVSR